MELSRRRPIVFYHVAFGIGATAFAASSISFCRRGTAAPAYPLNTVLQSRHASCAPEKSPLPKQPRVHTDSRRLRPTQWRTSDFLSECCKLVRCFLSALIQLILQFRVLPGQPLQRSCVADALLSWRRRPSWTVGNEVPSNRLGSTSSGSNLQAFRPSRQLRSHDK